MAAQNAEEKKQNAGNTGEVPEVKPVADETISVSKSKLEALLDRIARLEATASKAALANYDGKNVGAKGKTVKMRVFEGKRVKKEILVKNVVEKTPEGRWREEQELELTFSDGSTMKIPYVYYVRNYKHLTGRVSKEMKVLDDIEAELNGEFIFEVTMDDGEKIEVGSKFLN